MVSSISYLLAKNTRVTGFGVYRKRSTSCGRGYVCVVMCVCCRRGFKTCTNIYSKQDC